MVANIFDLSAIHTTNHFKQRPAHRLSRLLEALEQRTLLSSTLFVTAPGVPSDATHFQTLQAALVVAATGDTVVLQNGFSAGTFVSTSLSQPATAGATTIHTAASLDVGDVISVGVNSGGQTQERMLVTNVATSGSGDFLVTLASPLGFNHPSGASVSATLNSSTGPTIGIVNGITLTADPGVVMPFNVEIWQTATGVTLSDLNLSAAGANNVLVDGDGNTLTNLTAGNQITLNNAHGNSIDRVTVNQALVVAAGSSGNTVSNSTLAQVMLSTDSHGNSFVHNTIASMTSQGLSDNNGQDSFSSNTFTGAVVINGNQTTATTDSFVGNTFTVSNADALTLNNASGTTIQGNTFSESSDFANAVAIHNSDNVLVSGNQVTTTGNMGTGIYAFADGTGSTSVNITGNTLRTGNGFGLYLAKWDTTANFEASVQGNDLRNSAMGVTVFGDNVSAGNVDLGGGSTRFGSSTGMNDFTTDTTADANDYAIGLFGTNATFTVSAKNNLFSVADPMMVVVDGTHTPVAGGTGVVLATAFVPPPPPVETITESGVNVSGTQNSAISATVATFTDNFAHAAGDFTATINWGDGTSSTGTVTQVNGGFAVIGTHTYSGAGSFTFTVSVSSNSGATATAQGMASVAAQPVEVLSETANNLSGIQTGLVSGIVATFSSTFAHVAGDFTATISWGDGTTSMGIVSARSAADGGGFAVMASHSWASAGNFTFTVSISSNTGKSISAQATAAITARVLTVQGLNFTLDKKQTLNGAVAKFTDNLPGTTASSYVASVAWSDGMTTTATVTKNADGSFSINTSRGFTAAGVVVASVSVGTSDGLFSGTASLTGTITNSNGKVPGPKDKTLSNTALFVQMVLDSTRKDHGKDNGCDLSHDHGKVTTPVTKGHCQK